MSRIFRNKVAKNCAKSCVEFKDKKGLIKDMYIYRIGNKKDIEKIKKYASKNNYDVLDFIHSIKMSRKQWALYYSGMFTSLSSNNIYEYESLFIDIDMPLVENYHILNALKDSGIKNYQVLESASGNIHLYVKVQKFKRKQQYVDTIKLIGLYLEKHSIYIDPNSAKKLQKTYLEGFRVLKKYGFSSKEIQTGLNSQEEKQTYFDIHKILYKKGLKIPKPKSMKYAMRIVKTELFENCSRSLSLTNIEHQYLIPHSTTSRALKRLSEAKAITYTSKQGVNGGVQISHCNERLFNDCINRQLTRPQNYIYINVMYAFQILYIFSRNLVVKAFLKLCNYIEKNNTTSNIFILLFIIFQNSQGLLSGSSGFSKTKTGFETSNKIIKMGNRNKSLYQALLSAKAKGCCESELYKLSRKIHSRMQQTQQDNYSLNQVDSTLKWVLKLKFYNQGNNERTI